MGCTFGHRSKTVWKERCSKKKKKTTDPIQNCDSRENLLYGKKSTTLYIWCTRYTLRQTWTTSSGLSFEYPRSSRYLSWLGKFDLGLPQITTSTLRNRDIFIRQLPLNRSSNPQFLSFITQHLNQHYLEQKYMSNTGKAQNLGCWVTWGYTNYPAA